MVGGERKRRGVKGTRVTLLHTDLNGAKLLRCLRFVSAHRGTSNMATYANLVGEEMGGMIFYPSLLITTPTHLGIPSYMLWRFSDMKMRYAHVKPTHEVGVARKEGVAHINTWGAPIVYPPT